MRKLTQAVSALIGVLWLGTFACYGQPGRTSNPEDATKITALSKLFLRDSAELTMDVAVTTVITDPGGKEKRRSQSSVHFLFHGYNQQADKFTFDSRSGWFNTGALRDSLSGDYAVFEAFSRFAAKESGAAQPEIRQERPGRVFLLRPPNRECHGFGMEERVLYPTKYCALVEFQLGSDSAGDLTVERFTLDIAELPAPAKIVYLGDVQVQRIHSEGDIQKAYLPNDPLPFFIPKRVVTSIVTSKGSIALTNSYTLTPARGRKQ